MIGPCKNLWFSSESFFSYTFFKLAFKAKFHHFCDSLCVYAKPHQLLIFHWIGLKFALTIQKIICNMYSCKQLLKKCYTVTKLVKVNFLNERIIFDFQKCISPLVFTSLQPNFDSVQNFSCYRYKHFSEIININWIEVHVDLEEDTRQSVMKKHMTLLQSKLWQVVVKTTLLMV